MLINIKKAKNLPNNPGVYQFLDENNKIIYIGKAKNLRKRVSSYFKNKNLGPKTNLLVSKIKDIKIIKVFSEFEALLLEADLIKKNRPFFNVNSKDDKSPLYIKITSDEIPLITTARNQISQKKEFIKGPFTSSKTARDILKIVRKIFPYCHHKSPQKPCLFVDLKLCPFPYKSQKSKLNYQKNIHGIKKLLSGKSSILVKDLKKEMVRFSNDQKYEEANEIKKKIEKLELLTSTYHAPIEFLESPTLVDDLLLARLKDLQGKLILKKIPKKIECFDISNIQGKFAAGSMVVFENGHSVKENYRKFKIKFSDKPNDYQMLNEVLTRRFKNDWPQPDLIIIDGGRGQLNCALSICTKFKLNIPVISIAKKYEEIYTDNESLPLKLPKESLARQLVQQIRDEAHRFAITYHRLLRSKNLLLN